MLVSQFSQSTGYYKGKKKKDYFLLLGLKSSNFHNPGPVDANFLLVLPTKTTMAQLNKDIDKKN